MFLPLQNRIPASIPTLRQSGPILQIPLRSKSNEIFHKQDNPHPTQYLGRLPKPESPWSSRPSTTLLPPYFSSCISHHASANEFWVHLTTSLYCPKSHVLLREGTLYSWLSLMPDTSFPSMYAMPPLFPPSVPPRPPMLLYQNTLGSLELTWLGLQTIQLYASTPLPSLCWFFFPHCRLWATWCRDLLFLSVKCCIHWWRYADTTTTDDWTHEVALQ